MTNNLTQLAALTALRDFIEDHIALIRQTEQARLFVLSDDEGIRSLPIEVDGEKVASYSITEGKTKYVVTDEEKFLAWVAANYQNKIITVQKVDDDFRAAVLKMAEVEVMNEFVSLAVDPYTGTWIEGVTPTMPKRTTTLRFTKEGQSIIANKVSALRFPPLFSLTSASDEGNQL